MGQEYAGVVYVERERFFHGIRCLPANLRYNFQMPVWGMISPGA